ncbi:MAG: TIGR01244 family phosphatase [Alphaproteobacteria bacterium]|nr:MAG: TIGR01244 family phosphatase [Alphaproteobacteria bacterium]
MTGKEIEPGIYVSSQIALEDLPSLADAGVGLVICNRPDGEERRQPTAAEVARAAEALGLGFLHLPITALHEIARRPRLEELARAIAASTGHVLAYCRSGARSAALLAAKQVAIDGVPVEHAVRRLKAIGYDMPALKPLLAALAAKAGCARD